MIACLTYNIINIMAWCWLAERFGDWWIALFSIFTMIHSSSAKKSNGGGDESAPD